MSGLLPPLGTLTQHFGNQLNQLEYPYYHVGIETCAFNWYSGAVMAAHFHAGTDWSKGSGTPALAMETGTVAYVGWAPSPGTFAGGGIIVDVKIDGGMYYTICHLRSVAVSRGQRVSRGQVIGYEGATGIATGPHRHISIRTVNSYQASLFYNPEYFLTGGKYAGSALIRPAAAVIQYAVVNGAGVNIRTGPGTNYPVYRTSTSTYLIGVKMRFGGWVSGGSYTLYGATSNVWAKMMLNGIWVYAAKPLIHLVS